METIRTALIQLNSGESREDNLAQIEYWVLAAVNDGAKLIVTPEYSDIRGDNMCLYANATEIPGIVTQRMADLAQRTGCWIILGSMHELCINNDRDNFDKRLANTSVCFSPNGEIFGKYRKIHLYDALIDSHVYRESDVFFQGSTLQTVQIDNLTIGLTICYDLRFAELYRALRAKGASVLVVSSAFNVHTGRDHWEILLRARAIENQCYVLAAAQIGGSDSAIPCMGRSMIIDPWGVVLACMPDQVGYICADLNLAHVTSIRKALPVWQHQRSDLFNITET